MRKIYLHVGFGKTGSSALQSYLSLNQLPCSRGGESFVYCSAERSGRVIYGDALRVEAESSALKYCASAPDLARSSAVDDISLALDRIFEAGGTPVLSQEDWGQRGSEFISSCFLERINCTAHVIAYVRPQVDWFNSAWWQWYAWDPKFKCPSDVVDNWGFKFMSWAWQLSSWKLNPRVKEVIVTPSPVDIVGDFFSKLDIDGVPIESPYGRNNTSLTLPLIQLIKNLPIERRPHDAEVDIRLSRALDLPGGTPWSIEPGLVVRIISECFSDNIDLLRFMSPDSKVKMCSDPRWWCASPFQGRKLITNEDLKISSSETLVLASKLVDCLLKG